MDEAMEVTPEEKELFYLGGVITPEEMSTLQSLSNKFTEDIDG